MASSIQKNLASSNEKYAASFKEGDLALPPAKKYLVLTCMDARIDPAAAFGINLGDAHVIRNVSLPAGLGTTMRGLETICGAHELD